ncbi:MAG TPA: hypothetical protein VGE05_12185 [Novosphingobium sp.]
MPRIEPIPWDKLPPRERDQIERGLAAGAYTQPLPLQIFAYAAHAEGVSGDEGQHPNFPGHLLEPKLLELLRIRSAQLGGCEPCMASRKAEGATEDAVACLLDANLRHDLSPRERLAMEFIDLLATDHHKIGDDLYARMAEHFTTAEIVEVGMVAGKSIGTHRFLHTLNVFGETPPAIPYDPAQVGTTWKRLHGTAEAAE